MKAKITIFLIGLFMITGSLQLSMAQSSETKPYEDGFLKRFGVSLKGGTYGPGLDFHTSLLPNLKTRIGFNYLSHKYTDNIDFSADAADGGAKVDGNFTEASLKFQNVNVLFDFYPVKSGIFCFTAGAYIGNNKIETLGTADRAFLWDSHKVTPVGGKFNGTLNVGDVVKPYFGLGLGRTISNSRVSFRFDIGMVYQGNMTITSDNCPNEIDGLKVFKDNVDLSVSSEIFKLWPMMSFSLSYRIK